MASIAAAAPSTPRDVRQDPGCGERGDQHRDQACQAAREGLCGEEQEPGREEQGADHREVGDEQPSETLGHELLPRRRSGLQSTTRAATLSP